MALLQWCWQNRDANRYREIFTDDFRFAFGADDSTGDPYPDHAWTRDDELLAATHLFVGGGVEPPARGIDLSLDRSAQPGTSSIPGKTYPWHQQILTSVDLEVTGSDGSTRTVSDRVFLSVVRGDSAVLPRELVARGFTPDPNRWYIERWDDAPGAEIVVDHPPVVTAATALTVRVGTALTMKVAAADADGDPITSLTATAPPGANFVPQFDNALGTLTWTPGAGDAGSHSVTFTAANVLSGEATTTIDVVTRPNQPPIVRLAARPATGTEPLLVQLDASGSYDPDGTITSYRFDFGDGASVTQSGAALTHTYARGRWAAVLTETDNQGASVSANAVIAVSAPNQPPVASLVTRPATGREPLRVEIDASGSSDPDGRIVSYRFDFGDGVIQTQADPVATHVFSAGKMNVVLTVTDDVGAVRSAATDVTVSASAEPPVPNSAAGALALLKWCWSQRDVSRYQEIFTDDFRFAFGPGDPTGDPYADHAWTRYDELLAATHLFAGGGAEPPATSLALTFQGDPQPGSCSVPGKPYPWHQQILVPSLTMEVTRSNGSTLGATGRALFSLVRGDSAVLPPELIARGFKPDSSRWYIERWDDVPGAEVVVDHAPVVTAPAIVNAKVGTTITFNVSAQDPDGDPIGALSAVGIGWAIFAPSPDHRTATVTWTPTEGDVGSRQMAFAASNALTGSARTTVYVISVAQNLVRNPSFETDTKGWNTYAGSTLLRMPGGTDGTSALQMTGPPVIAGSFGVNDSPDWVRPTLQAGLRYRYTAWVRSASSTGTARLRVCEYRILTGAKLGQATSAGARLSPDWQMITVDYVTTSAASTLDFQVRDFPNVPGEVFLTDNISIRDVTVAAAAEPWAGDPQSEWTADEENALEPTLYPSPIRSSGFLGFSTSRGGALRVEILDLAGRRVRRLMDERDAPAGMHFVTVQRTGDDGSRLGAGVYFYRIEAAEKVKTGRFVMLR